MVAKYRDRYRQQSRVRTRIEACRAGSRWEYMVTIKQEFCVLSFVAVRVFMCRLHVWIALLIIASTGLAPCPFNRPAAAAFTESAQDRIVIHVIL